MVEKSISETLRQAIEKAQRDRATEPKPKKDPEWLDIWDAVVAAMEGLEASQGRAEATVVKACASGEVRYRDTSGPFPPSAWRDARIDLDRGEVLSGHGVGRSDVEVNAGDLAAWLKPQRRPPAAADRQAPPSNGGKAGRVVAECMRILQELQKAGTLPARPKEQHEAVRSAWVGPHKPGKRSVERARESLGL